MTYRFKLKRCHCSLLLFVICVALINMRSALVSVGLMSTTIIPATLDHLKTAIFQGRQHSVNVTSDSFRSFAICPEVSTPNIGLGGEYLCHPHPNYINKTYLTLFTTMISREDKVHAFNRTLSLWPLLGPNVKVVLYLTPSSESSDKESYAPNLKDLATRACKLGWDVLVAPTCNAYNYPVVSSMFLKSHEISTSTWYGYANGDILFTEDLMHTLKFLERQNETRVDFVIGRRRNIVLPDSQKFSSLEEVWTAAVKAHQHRTDAQDYFFVRKDQFPWKEIPAFVVGRTVYDNWLVWYCLVNNIAVVDASGSIHAVHQSLEGFKSDHGRAGVRSDGGRLYNQDIAGNWTYQISKTSCTPLRTKVVHVKTKHEIVLLKRRFHRTGTCVRILQEDVIAFMDINQII